MKKLLDFLTSGRFLFILIFVSLVMIAFGFWLIRSVDQPQVTPSSSEAEIPLPPLPVIENERPADLADVQTALASMAEGVIPVSHGLSKEDITTALAETTPGSEAWCDLLLLADDEDWTESQSRGFAESCI